LRELLFEEEAELLFEQPAAYGGVRLGFQIQGSQLKRTETTRGFLQSVIIT
jgi:hypothetical protein